MTQNKKYKNCKSNNMDDLQIMKYVPCSLVDLPFDEDNKYFFYLLEAIRKVDKKFVTYEHEFSKHEHNYIAHLERVFAYELYRQWGNIIKSEGEDLVLNGEIRKTLTFWYDASGKKARDLYPDLVLHHSQGDDTHQVQICEIKRNLNLGGAKILDDLYKLACYMDKDKYKSGYKNPFIYGVFILINGKLSEIKKKIKERIKVISQKCNDTKKQYETIKEEIMKHYSNIVCIAYDGDNIEYNTLKNIYPKLKQYNDESSIDNINCISLCPRGKRPRH